MFRANPNIQIVPMIPQVRGILQLPKVEDVKTKLSCEASFKFPQLKMWKQSCLLYSTLLFSTLLYSALLYSILFYPTPTEPNDLWKHMPTGLNDLLTQMTTGLNELWAAENKIVRNWNPLWQTCKWHEEKDE